MSYMMRDRPDGQVEIVLSRPILVGVFPERDTAEKFMVFLEAEGEPDLIEEHAANFGRAAKDVDEALGDVLDDIPEGAVKATNKTTAPKPQPLAVDRPKQPVTRIEKVTLSDEDTDAAFKRIAAGEKIADVATDFGMSMYQLRGIWAVHCRHTQRHLAEGGQVECTNCKRSFTPSLSHPDTCARCSK